MLGFKAWFSIPCVCVYAGESFASTCDAPCHQEEFDAVFQHQHAAEYLSLRIRNQGRWAPPIVYRQTDRQAGGTWRQPFGKPREIHDSWVFRLKKNIQERTTSETAGGSEPEAKLDASCTARPGVVRVR